MILVISGKVSDLFSMSVYDDNGDDVLEYVGYVPDGLNIGSGDYIEMDIDMETGTIVDWKPITLADAQKASE